MNFKRHRAALIVVAALIPSAAGAETWPARTVSVVAASAPGGTHDVFARLLAPGLSTALGQAVIVDNRAGAGSNIGYQSVAQAKPDGYTLLIGALPLASAPFIYKTLTYDPQRDLQPIRLIARIPNLVVVNAKSDVRSVKELVDLLKRNPGKYNYASPGAGTSVHLGTELFKDMTGTDILGVHYKSSAQSISAVLANEVLVAFENIPVALPHVRAGTLRALAVTSTTRSANLPDVPSMAEAGIAGYDVSSWFGLLAPTGTPPEVIRRLDEATLTYVKSPSMQEKLRAMGAEPASEGSDAFRQFIRAESEKWGKVIRKAGIKAE